jgi:protein SCO1/2/putative membrane protein
MNAPSNETPANAVREGEARASRRRWLIWIGLGLLILLAGGARSLLESRRESAARPAVLPVYGQLPEFEFVERSAAAFGSRDLRGKTWIADFVFTRCTGPCPVMTSKMRELQNALPPSVDIKLVSISVDPEHDSPEVLTRYASAYGAQPGRWFFLTGKPEPIYDLARQSFKMTVQRSEQADAEDDGGAIIHSTHFILVDGVGQIRGYYDSEVPESLGQLRADAVRLATAPGDGANAPADKLSRLDDANTPALPAPSPGASLPTLNAALNATSTSLLLAGFWAVRTGRLVAHRYLMLGALTCSAAFLVSYLIYHFGFHLTRRYEGPWRPFYLTILLTHTVLAAGVLPLVLMTTARALRAMRGDPRLRDPQLRERFAQHRAIARWTFPIWLYVSLTGVTIYWMLYRMAWR